MQKKAHFVALTILIISLTATIFNASASLAVSLDTLDGLSTDELVTLRLSIDNIIQQRKNSHESIASDADVIQIDRSGRIALVDFKHCDNGNIVAIMENISEEQVSFFRIQFLFMDESGNIVKVEQDGHDAVLPGSLVATLKRYVSIEPGEYEMMDFNFEVEIGTNKYKNHAANLIVNGNNGKDGVILQITNTSDVLLDEVEVVVVYYCDGTIVGASEAEKRDVPSDETIILEFSYPKDASFKVMDFDDYRVYINQAHTF